MNSDSSSRGLSVAGAASDLIVRTSVPIETDYLRYRPYLRKDFLYSCAYCTLTEAEGLGIRFTIDHYEPKALRADLECVYENLMYACGECNLRKGDLSPPEAARMKGIRFFRPDTDMFHEHFECKYDASGWIMAGITPIGNFTVEFLDLNRQWLRRLREIRHDLEESIKFVAFGINALRGIPLDRLPSSIKGKAAEAIRRKVLVMEYLEDQVDDALRAIAHSEMLDEDPELEERAAARAKSLTGMKSLFPGDWRSPRRGRGAKPRRG